MTASIMVATGDTPLSVEDLRALLVRARGGEESAAAPGRELSTRASRSRAS